MTYADEMQPASFRGVPFHVRSNSGRAGRIVVIHQFGSRQALPEDVGPVPEKFGVDGFVVGPGYHRERDRLIAALNEPGPGTLVLPTLGEMEVLAEPCRWRESFDRRRALAEFTLDVIRVADSPQPTAVKDTAGDAAEKAGEAADTAEASFAAAFSLAGAIADVQEAAVARVRELTTKLRAVQAQVQAVVGKIEEIADAIEELSDTIESLVLAPVQLANAVRDVIFSAIASINDIATAARAWRTLADFGSGFPSIGGATPQAEQERANQQALADVVRRAAVAAAVKAASNADYESVEQAFRIRDELGAELADLADAAEGDDYFALLALRAALIEHIASIASGLARVGSFIVPQTMPIALVSHLIYGEDRSDDLLARNEIRHPGFVEAGTVLEVLRDAA